jgi:copper transport protein
MPKHRQHRMGRGAASAARDVLMVSLALSASLALASPALGHAILERSEPADGAVLDEPPEEVRLWFSDEVAPDLSGAVLLDGDGRRVGSTVTRIDPSRPGLIILNVPQLGDGAYTIEWKAFAEDDGHLLRGSLVFRVGAGPPPAPAGPPAPEGLPSRAEAVLRWLYLAAVVSVTGAIAVAGWVLPGGRDGREADRAARRRVIAWGTLAAAAALVAVIGLLGHEVVTLAEGSEDGVTVTLAWQLLTGSRWGALWAIRALLLVALVAALLVARRADPDERSGRFVGLAPAGLLVASTAVAHTLAGHAAGSSDEGLNIVAGTVHLLAAGIWMGGIVALLVAASARREAGFASPVRARLRRFGALALVSVGLLAATGLYRAGREVASVDALLGTFYGRALLGKTGLFLAAGAFGLANAILLRPRVLAPLARLLRKPDGWTPLESGRLRPLVMAEAGLGVLVLLGASLLGASAPARGPRFERTPERVPTTLTRTVDDLLVTVSVKPNRPGANVFEVLTASTVRPARTAIEGVTLRLTEPGDGGTLTTPALSLVGPGRYRTTGDFLSGSGAWRLEAVIERPSMDETVAIFDWPVGVVGAPRSPVASDAPLEPLLTRVAAALLLALAAGLAWSLLPRRPSAIPAAPSTGVPAAVEATSEGR